MQTSRSGPLRGGALALGLAGAWLCSPAFSAEFFVAAEGNDAHAGTQAQPWATLQKALDQAGPGDRVRVAAGTFHGRVAFKKGGEPGKPVVLEGDPGGGTVLDGSTPWTPKWEAANDVAPGVFRAKIPFKPDTLTADGKYIAALVERKAPAGIFAQGVRNEEIKDKAAQYDADFSGVGALWMYREKTQEVLVRFQGNKDPVGMVFTAAPLEACVTIKDFNHCVVRGLVLKNAHYGVFLLNTEGSVAEYCTVRACDHGVWMDKGARKCVARRCDISLNPIWDAYSKKNEFVWIAMKDFGYSDRRGVELRNCGDGNEVAYNYIHEHHDGIETKCDDPEPSLIRDTEVHHNLVGEILDDALEPNAGEVNARWHHNRVTNEGMGMRIKHPYKGPLYIYRNLFEKGHFWCYKASECEVYAYHNTVLAPYALRATDMAIPHYHFFNNVFLSRAQYLFSVLPEAKRIVPNAGKDQFDYNLITGDPEGLARKAGFEQHGIPVASIEKAGVDLTTFLLQPGSPALDAGMDLSHFAKPLPDCAAGYFAGKAPDLGCFESGLDPEKQALGVDPRATGAVAKRE